jgi:hypothetical protein
MPSTIFRLFYVSRATRPLANGSIRSILQVARRNNDRLDITGCLLFSGQYFAQILEGRREVVSTLADRIADDDRHCNVRFVPLASSDRRDYASWSMGYVHDLLLEDELAALHAGRTATANIAGLVERIRPDTVMGALG